MELVFDKSFSKSLDKLNDQAVKEKIAQVILNVEAAKSLTEISNVKKMQGFRSYYRIRIGDHRIGVELEDPNTIRFIIVMHRKDIYKKFP